MPTRRNLLTGALGAAIAAVGFPGMAAAARSGDRLDWSPGPDLLLPLQEIYAALHGEDIWIAGGLTVDTATGEVGLSARALRLGPEGLAWVEGPRLPAPLHHPQLVSAGEVLYVVGGFEAANGGMWAMRAGAMRLDGDEWQGIVPMPAPLAETHTGVLDGRMHLAGGRVPSGEANAQWDDHTDTGTHFVYDAAEDFWTVAPALPTPRNSGAAATVDNRLYVIGGRTVSGGNLATMEMFDPVLERWTALSPMPEARGGIAAAARDGTIYVFGGEYFNRTGAGGVFKTVFAYDIAADSWREMGPMPAPRHGLAAVTRGGAIHVIGGATEVGARGTSALTSIAR